jgi:hypothetical protein
MLASYEHIKFWCQKVLPLVYDESLSYYEVLDKAVKYFNDIIDEQKELVDIITPLGESVNDLKAEVDIVSAELEKVKTGGYVSLYLNSLIAWIDSNIQTLVGRIVKYIAFYLDDTGHLCADIPSTWDFLKFDTVIDTNDVNYGHLILEW